MSSLRWGVVSTAKIGREQVIPGIQAAARCEVVAIGGRDLDRTRGVADELAIASAYGSYEEVIEAGDVDAVYIPLPNHLHAEWTIAAARAGKHVLCEKPLALTSADAQRMVDACDSAGVSLMEAFMYRLHPSWVAVRDIVASGRIGELRTVQSWFSYFNDDPSNIRNIAEYGGGALMDVGCYSVNLSRMLFGGEPLDVVAHVQRDPHAGVDVLTSAHLTFEGGTATFTCSTRTEPDQRVHCYGTDGRISIEIPFNIPPHLPTRVLIAAGGDPPVDPAVETVVFEPADQYAIEAEMFAAAVLDGTPLPTPPQDGVANMVAIERILAADRGS